MPLIVRLDFEEVSPGEIRFGSSEVRRGSQKGVLRVHRDGTDPSVSVKPMSSPYLEQLMFALVYENVLSNEAREAIFELAEGFFLAGIEYAN